MVGAGVIAAVVNALDRRAFPIDVEQTDLRIGANYSWDRGAAWLIKSRLLEKQARQ